MEIYLAPLKIQGLHRILLFLELPKTALKKIEWGMFSFSLISIEDSEIAN